MSSKFASFQLPNLATCDLANKWLSDTKYSDTFSHFTVEELRGVFITARLCREERQNILKIRTRQLKRKSKQDIRQNDRICDIKLSIELEGLKWERDQLLKEQMQLYEEIKKYANLRIVPV